MSSFIDVHSDVRGVTSVEHVRASEVGAIVEHPDPTYIACKLWVDGGDYFSNESFDTLVDRAEHAGLGLVIGVNSVDGGRVALNLAAVVRYELPRLRADVISVTLRGKVHLSIAVDPLVEIVGKLG